MKRFALLFFVFSFTFMAESASAQEVKIDLLANTDPAGKIYAKCTVRPAGKPFDRIYLHGVPIGGGPVAIAAKEITTVGDRPLVVEFETNKIGGQIPYDCFAVITYKEGNDVIRFSSKKDAIMLPTPADNTDRGKAELPGLFSLGGGRFMTKIAYAKAGDWRARDANASIHFFPMGGGRSYRFEIEKTAGRDEWKKDVGRVNAADYSVFALVEVYDTRDPAHTKPLATKLRKADD